MLGTSISGCDPLTHAHTYMDAKNREISEFRLEAEALAGADTDKLETPKPSLFVRYARVLQSMRMHEIVYLT